MKSTNLSLNLTNAQEGINMKKKIVAFFVLIQTQLALAVSDPCTLMQSPLPSHATAHSQVVESYRNKLKVECDITTRYRYLRNELASKYRVALTDITEYQAMRFVRRVNFEDSKAKEIPIELTYQINRSQYNLPNEQKSSVIWDNWIKGISQLESLRNSTLQGKAFDFEALKRAHVGFFQLSREVGDDAHIPDEGIIKPPADYDNYWWAFETEAEAKSALTIVNNINDHYQRMGLLPSFPDPRMKRVLDVRQAQKRQPDDRKNLIEYVWVIYSGHTKANKEHVNNILYFANTLMKAAINNEHLIWNGVPLTPAEVAYLTQKFYIGVHPFSEGNGRTGRLLQELILTVMDMPHGSSGDLMDSDVLSTFADYYTQAMTGQVKVLNTMLTCLTDYSQLANISLAKAPLKNINYSCRILTKK
jgi:hypothetical protein